MLHPSRRTRIGLLLSLALLVTCGAGRAQTFSTPKIVSNNSQAGAFAPIVGLDGAGHVYMVWEDDGNTNANIMFSRSLDGGVTFSAPLQISNSTAFSFNPQIAVDNKGGINLVWLDDSPGSTEVFFSRSTDGGNSFSSPLNLSNGPADTGNVQVATDANGNIHVIWENTDITFGTFYSRSTNGGASFSAPVNLTGANAPSSTSGSKLALDSNGNVFVTWYIFTNALEVVFTGSTNNGASFSSPAVISNASDNAFNPALVVDASGNVDLMWIDSGSATATTATPTALMFSRSMDHGTTFSAATTVYSNSAAPSSPQMGVDTLGNVFIVWQQNSIRDILLSRSTTGGSTFSAPVNVSNTSGNSNDPWIAVDAAGNVNIAWLDTTPGRAQVFFTRSTDHGATFSTPPQNISHDSGTAENLDLVTDSNNDIGVGWDDDATHLNQVLFSGVVNAKPAQPPVANAGMDQTLTATGPTGATVALDGSGSTDPNGLALSYVWTEGTTVIGNTATVAFTASIGTHTYTLTVKDTAGLSSSATVHVTVNNAPPVANAGMDQTLTATGPSTPVTLNGSATDPDGDALSFVWTQGGTVLGNTATLPLKLSVGTYTFTLTATDAGGLSSSAVTHVTINNAPPVANAGMDQTLTATGPTTPVTLNGSGTDPDGEALSFVWTQGSTVLGNTATLPLKLSVGTYTFTLTVTDAGGLSASAVTHVTINNAPPVANAGADQTLTATGPTTPVTLNGSGTDPDGEALTFVWTQGSTVVGNTATLPLKLSVGTYTFTLTVTDAGGLSSSAVTHVTINNAPPAANAGADQTLTATSPSGAAVTLSGSGTDPDGDALTFVWTEGSTVVGNAAVVTLTASIGTHTYTLTVTDAGGLSSTAVTHVTVSARPPVANAGADQTVPATGASGASVTLNGSASSDPNGYALSFVWTEGSTVVGNAAVVTLTASIGTHTYTLTVKDTAGLSSSAVIHVTVTAQAPVAVVMPDPTVQCTSPQGAMITLDGSASQGSGLSYTWTEGSTVVGTTAKVQFMASLGSHTYTLTVSNFGGSSHASTIVNVVDNPPVLGFTLATGTKRLRDNQMVLVNATINVSDVCDANPTVKLVSITSNDPPDLKRQRTDVQAVGGGPVAFGTDVTSFELRAERPENNTSLVYTVTYAATNSVNKTTTTSVKLNLAAR